MELSRRLKEIAGLVTEGAFVADIGTDHAYVPVYLLQQGICNKVLAMDINKGPLERARMNIQSYGFEEQIETRLSNGFTKLKRGEVDCVIIAGMGGPLMQRILTEYPGKTASIKEFILQPQSEIKEFRKFLITENFKIIEESMIYEDSLYYPMMKVVHGYDIGYREVDYKYGKLLIQSKRPELIQYIENEISHLNFIISKLSANDNPKTLERIEELKHELSLANQALGEMYNEM